jgi:hypothetical protein
MVVIGKFSVLSASHVIGAAPTIDGNKCRRRHKSSEPFLMFEKVSLNNLLKLHVVKDSFVQRTAASPPGLRL